MKRKKSRRLLKGTKPKNKPVRIGDSSRGIRRGDIVAYPTESFFALGVDATKPKAIRQLFRMKHREKGKPIALIASDLKQAKKFFVMNAAETRLARQHWPGSLTILLKPKTPTTPNPSPFGLELRTERSGRRGKYIAASALFPLVRGGKKRGQGARRIGVRVPAQAGARRLAARTRAPITATSANISGQPPTKSAAKVKRDFPGILMLAGSCGQQKQPSTIVRLNQKKIIIIRQGSVYL